MPDYYFDDFHVGMRFETAAAAVSEADIIAFARQFDPQYYHVDPDAARRSAFGGLIASGLHTLSLCFRQFFDLDLWPNAIIASPGMTNLKWPKPVRPGDMIRSVVDVIEVRPSESKVDRGVIVTRHTAMNQRDETVLSADCAHLVRRKNAAP
jgi:acyl dehydratase